MGKIQVIKSFALPKFMYRASLISLDKTMIKTINSIMFKFLWKGKDKIRWLALISEYKDGGLRMPHVESSITAQITHNVPQKIYRELFQSMESCLSYFLRDYGGDLILRCNFNPPIPRTTTSQDFIVIVQLHGPLSTISEFLPVIRSLMRYYGIISFYVLATNHYLAKSFSQRELLRQRHFIRRWQIVVVGPLQGKRT